VCPGESYEVLVMVSSIKLKLSASALVLGLFAGCAQNDRHAESPQRDSDGQNVFTGNPDALKPRDGFEAKTADPKIDANTFFAAGQLAESRAMYPEAIDKYRAALKQDPKQTKAMYRLAVVYAMVKQYNDAINTWQSYLKVTNNAPQAFANLGFCYELAGRPVEAEDAYQRGIAKDSKNVPCRINYGLMLARTGKLSEASVQLQTVLTKAEVHYNLGSVLQSQGKTEQAKVHFQEALKLDPNFKDARSRLAEMGEPPAAKTAVSKTE
jgi:tetratricopeptide (TPR) repeat protein